MSMHKNWIVVAAMVVATDCVIALEPRPEPPAPPAPNAAPAVAGAVAENAAALPRLLELGADKCIPCRMMAPILTELRQEYSGKLQVDFIDVWKNPEAGDTYGVRVIPLQIFFDAAGRELFRHEGFFAKEDILAKWKELGFTLE